MLIGFGKAEQHYNGQLAAAYIFYMMAGSRFRRCRFHNTEEENHLKLHYLAMKERSQLDLEARIEDALLETGWFKGMQELTCVVSGRREGTDYCLTFRNGRRDLRVVFHEKGLTEIIQIAVSQ